jgi:hypothetical protein
VVGSAQAASALSAAGFPAQPSDAKDAALLEADVVVLETGGADWLPLAQLLQVAAPDVVLISGPQAELADLLEAINTRAELVAPIASGAAALVDRVRSMLLRRAVNRAQAELAEALAEFQGELRSR